MTRYIKVERFGESVSIRSVGDMQTLQELTQTFNVTNTDDMNLSLLSVYQQYVSLKDIQRAMFIPFKKERKNTVLNPRILSILHLFSDLVTQDLGPVHLAAGDWQLSA